MTDRIADLDDVDHDEALAGDPDVLRVDLEASGAGAQPGTSFEVAAEAAPSGPGPTGRPTWRERRRNRISKWDRPPEPKDWRYFVGTLGKVLIATGLLMFGFVAYQLWGTGIETARAQNRLESAFEQAIAANVDADEAEAPSSAPPLAAVPDDASVEPDADETDTDAAPVDEPLPDLPEPVPSEIIPGGVDLSDVAVEQDVPAIDRGDVIARLEIPKIGKDLFVVAGVAPDDLQDGPGHYPETPLPGQLGNASIAGHRTTYGAPFFDVDQLVAGDQLIVTSITGDRFVYEVTGTQIVSASDYWVVTTRDPNVAELTLTSCHPKYTARDRIVVTSVLVPELSSNVGTTQFYELDDDGSGTIPGDDPTLAEPADDTANNDAANDDAATDDADNDDAANDDTANDDAATDDAANDTLVAEIDDDAAVDLTDGGATAPAPVDDDATALDPSDDGAVPAESIDDEVVDAPAAQQPTEIDAFSRGWFDDEEAWPQIALWGLALTIISLLAYQLSKKTRHDSIGFMFGIGPFLFCLYFFFQNVNRLLPPGL